jgi:hypothetical protein
MNNAAYVRAIRGPVLLMALGFLMLVDHLTSVSFWRLWPALLIVMGILVLAERAATTPLPTMAGMQQPAPFSSMPPTAPSPYSGAFNPPGAPRQAAESGSSSSNAATSGGGDSQ